MNIHCLQHVAFEGPAFIQDWAQRKSHTLTATRLDLGEALPGTSHFDWLVVMGGPMNVYEHDLYPWLVQEKKLIENAIADGKIVLGICLGAQLIADVLGAQVVPNPVKEIGWFPVALTDHALKSKMFAGFPPKLDVLHWHGDTFNQPAEAIHVARSAVCENQAFIYDHRVVALQFHLEMTDTSARAIMEHCGHELTTGPSIQSAEAMLADPHRFEKTHAMMEQLLDRLAALDG
ncbi:MAG TPA: amidotransferase [Verrucomicrobia bacterium]|nr:MAG: amidotransferase [Lentisphaerae bacterium GWF2_57_35]HBA82716.1 amidotransferase [Verrucomicrobiota bacterium]